MIPTSLFVLVVVPDVARRRYLVVEERDGTYYLPAGKVEPGENLIAAAVRETAEEAGVIVGLRGLLGFDHDWERKATRMRLRFVFVGYLAVASAPKSVPDRHSRGASWVTKDELRALPLRHPEVTTWIERYERANVLLPCGAYEPRGEGPTEGWTARIG
jgi:8-oxo-dGTP pyrophosphatase MutT (NUDIX family)